MKFIALIISLSIVSGSALPATAGSLTLTHLRGNVYYVEDDFFAKENSAVYIGKDHVTVVGATWSPETAQLLTKEIAKVTKQPITEVIDTNYHPDRIGGNAYFRSIGARIISTDMTRDLIKSGYDDVVAGTRKAFPDYAVIAPTLPDITYPGDFSLQGGNVKAMYFGPAHTPDGILVYFPDEKVLYGGCTLKEQLGNLAYANIAEYPNTLRKLQQANLGYTTIIAGHYSPIHGPELVDQYIALLAQAYPQER